jgi:hypothetical protein
MLANEVIDAYFRALAEGGPITDYIHSARWTLRATAALLHVGLQAFPEGERTAKNHPDRFARSEHMTLDVMIADPATWGPPLFVAEHENAWSKNRVQYDAWKLLAVEARRRVLVAYYGKGTEFATFKALEAAVKDVCKDNVGKDIILIGGDCAATPTSVDELRKAHESAIVGVHTTP